MSAVKDWLDQNGFYCERQRARLSFASCEKMREIADKWSRCYQCNEYPKRGVKMIEEGSKVKGGLNKGPSMARPADPPKGQGIKYNPMGNADERPLCTIPGCKSQQYRKAVESGQTVCYRHWKGPGARKGTIRRKGKRFYNVDEGRTETIMATADETRIGGGAIAVEDRLTKMLIPEPDFAIEKGQVRKIEVRLPMPIIDKVNLIVSVNARNMRQINRSDVIRIMIEDACQKILDGMQAKGLIKNVEDTKGD